MAEMIVRRVDKVHKDFYLNCAFLKRGDVVGVAPDGHVWSPRELSNPEWVIVKLPKLSVSEASVFMQRERDSDPRNPSKTLQLRQFKFDLDHPSLAKFDLDHPQKEFAVVELEQVVLKELAVPKPAIEDPAVFAVKRNIF